ncbi:YcxB family protein [Ectothiorhodospiraceae bacterium WFHF3C12]|nr:YcxB family protein [Ectothiorhodospiraceae bacterium WFHF3C12]
MDQTVTLRYDDALVRSALRGYVGRYIGWKFRVLVALMAVGLAVLSTQGIWRWYTLLLAAILAACVLVPLFIHAAMVPMLTRRFRALYGDAASFRFTGEGLSVETANHSGHTPWNRLRRLWRLPTAWLLFTGTDSFTILPTAGLPEEVREFIIQRVESNGGEVS